RTIDDNEQDLVVSEWCVFASFDGSAPDMGTGVIAVAQRVVRETEVDRGGEEAGSYVLGIIIDGV
ncbi:hypothetical protein H0H81_004544, partial [Sphagnurus paluster]